MRAASIWITLMAACLAVCPLVSPVEAGPATETRKAATRKAASVIGRVWDSKSRAVPYAMVRLRNLANGKVEATVRASDGGQFTFTDVEGGAYVVEVINDAGQVVAVGAPINVEAGETVATIVRLGGRRLSAAGLFGNAASSAVAAAAVLGVTAVGFEGSPISPSTAGSQ